MFKKLKEKVIDSQTSQRIQQITQTVSDKFQNLDKEDNFFSLTEDDNSINSPSLEPGFSNISLTSSTPMEPERNRRNSISSVTSDTSFLHRCDSLNSIYHLQSDLDVSEIEDNASSVSSSIGHLSKEQIYSAFQKSQMRYHKYRGRFTDLANHYKNLEREFGKLKTELEKTQERSFRRAKELKEQCELEQKAKAHLESSLRVDLDEKQIQINTLKEKITLLQRGSNQMLDYDQLKKNYEESKQENEALNSANQEIKAKLIVFQSKENEYKEKIKKLGEDLDKLKEDEKENNIKIAQSKMQIHNELISKEAELNSLKHDNESLKESLNKYETNSSPSQNLKMDQLLNQNKNLIEKVENLSQKCQMLSNEALKTEQLKIELQNLKTKITEEKSAHDNEIIEITKEAENFKSKLFKEKQEKEEMIDDLEKMLFDNQKKYESELSELKEKLEKTREDAKKGLLSIEEKIRKKYDEEFEEKSRNLREEFESKVKLMSSSEEGTKELQLNLMSMKEQLEKSNETNEELRNKLDENMRKFDDLEKHYLELNAELTREKAEKSKLEKKLQHFDGMEERIARLQANISTLQQENSQMETTQKEWKFKFETLEKERNEAKHNFDGLKEEFEKISDLNKNNELKVKEYRENLERLQSTSAKFEESSQEIIKLQSEIENLLSKLTKIEHEKYEAINIRENLEKDLEGMREEITLKDEESQRIIDEIKVQTGENSELKNKLNELTLNLEEIRGKLTDEENRNNELLKLKAELERKCEDLHKNSEENLEVQSEEIQKQFTRIDELNVELNNKNAKLEKLNKDLEVKVQYIKNLEENYKILEGIIESKKKEVEDCKKESHLKSENLIKLENGFAEIQKNKKVLLKELNDLKQTEKNYHSLLDENENLKEQISEIVLLQEKLRSLSDVETKHSKLEKIHLEKLETIQNLMQELDEVKTKFEISKRENDSFNELNVIEKDGILTELEEMKRQVVELNNEKQELESKLAKLESSNEKFKVLSNEFEYAKSSLAKLKEEHEDLVDKNKQICSDNTHISEENSKLMLEVEELKLNVENYSKTQVELEEKEIKSKLEKSNLQKTIDELKLNLENAEKEIYELRENKINPNNFEDTQIKYEELIVTNEKLNTEHDELKKTVENYKEEKRKFENTIKELERRQNDLLNEKQLLKEEIDEYKISPISNVKLSNGLDHEKHAEMEEMVDKLTQLKSLDLTNKATIDFYEDELQKLKNKNEKLNRKLDETLVTLNHCAELSQSTELEYLKNVLFNYMLGKESMVLARVIATVCKFDNDQTEEILKKEQQKQTLLAKLGII